MVDELLIFNFLPRFSSNLLHPPRTFQNNIRIRHLRWRVLL
jgi:hypothetical protein